MVIFDVCVVHPGLYVLGDLAPAGVVGFVLVAAQDPYHGVKIADELASVRGQPPLPGAIYIVDSRRVQIVGFTYTGTLSNGAFLMGTTELSSISDSDQAAMVVDMPGMGASLGTYDNDRLVLTVPNGDRVTSFKYFGIGSSDTKQLHYAVTIPAGLVPPAPVVIGQFVTRAHQVSSGDVTVINDRSIMINGFNYDGSGPDAFFYVGITDNVQLQSAPYGKIPDENGIINEKAKLYRDKDILLTLPESLSARNIKWLSMFCISFRHNFGEVVFAGVSNVPPYIGMGAVEGIPVAVFQSSNGLELSYSVYQNASNVVVENGSTTEVTDEKEAMPLVSEFQEDVNGDETFLQVPVQSDGKQEMKHPPTVNKQKGKKYGGVVLFVLVVVTCTLALCVALRSNNHPDNSDRIAGYTVPLLGVPRYPTTMTKPRKYGKNDKYYVC